MCVNVKFMIIFRFEQPNQRGGDMHEGFESMTTTAARLSPHLLNLV